MKFTNRVKALLGALVFTVVQSNAMAGPISPNDPSLTQQGVMPTGNLFVDTGHASIATSPLLTYSGGTIIGDIVSQASGPEIAVFLFNGGSVLGAGDIIKVTTGSRPVALLFAGSVRIEGTIDVSGLDGESGGANQGTLVRAGVAGGGRGGAGAPFHPTLDDGVGPGGGEGGSSSASSGGAGPGGGGGFGTAGGDAGASVTLVDGGDAYGPTLSSVLQGGSGGGGGGGTCCVGRNFQGGAEGGGGGGAVEIGALTTLEFAGATVLANGGMGGGPNFRIGGGGSGGGILMHAYDISVDAFSTLTANGGAPGNGSIHGGCGGAGRIEAITNTNGTFTNAGLIEAIGFGVCADGALVASSDAGIGQPSGVSSVSEPAMLSLLGLGLLGCVSRRRHQINQVVHPNA